MDGLVSIRPRRQGRKGVRLCMGIPRVKGMSCRFSSIRLILPASMLLGGIPSSVILLSILLRSVVSFISLHSGLISSRARKLGHPTSCPICNSTKNKTPRVRS